MLGWCRATPARLALPLAPARSLSLPCDMDNSVSTRNCSTTNVRAAKIMTDALAHPDGSFARVHVLSLARYLNSSTSRCCRRHIARRRHAGHPHRSPVYLLLSPQEACVRTSSTTRTARRTDRAIHECPRADREQVPQPANPRVLASRSQEVRRFAGGGHAHAPPLAGNVRPFMTPHAQP